MKLDTVEKWARLAGGAGLMVFMAAMLQGLLRGWHRPMGRMAGPAPGFVQGYPRGAWWFYLPATVLGLRLMVLLWRPIQFGEQWEEYRRRVAGWIPRCRAHPAAPHAREAAMPPRTP